MIKLIFEKIKKYVFIGLACLGLCFIFFSFIWFFQTKNSAERMENTIQHAVNMKPLIIDMIKTADLASDINDENDIIFSFHSTKTTVFRDKFGYEKKQVHIYTIIQTNKQKLLLIGKKKIIYL